MTSRPEVAASEHTMKASKDFSIYRHTDGKCVALSPREAQPATGTAIVRRRSRESYGRFVIASMDQVNRNCGGLGFDAQRPKARFDQFGVLPPLHADQQYSADVNISKEGDPFRRFSSDSVASTAASTSDSNLSDGRFLQHTFGCKAQMITDEVSTVGEDAVADDSLSLSNLQSLECEDLMARCLRAKGFVDHNRPCSKPSEDGKMSEPNARQNVAPPIGVGFGRPGQDRIGNNLAKAGATMLEQRRNQLEKKVAAPRMGEAIKEAHTGMRRRQEMLGAELDNVNIMPLMCN